MYCEYWFNEILLNYESFDSGNTLGSSFLAAVSYLCMRMGINVLYSIYKSLSAHGWIILMRSSWKLFEILTLIWDRVGQSSCVSTTQRKKIRNPFESTSFGVESVWIIFCCFKKYHRYKYIKWYSVLFSCSSLHAVSQSVVSSQAEIYGIY